MSEFNIRFGISFIVASFVSLALFYLMQYMISGNGRAIEKPENYKVVDFVRLVREPEEAKSQALKRIPPPKPMLPPNSRPSSMMKLAQGQPPATAMFSDTARALRETMQLAKPDPLTELISKVIFPEKPAAVARASSVESEIQKSALASSKQKPLSGDAAAPDGAAQAILGKGVDSNVEAVPVFKIEPIYPRKAAKNRIEGWVKIEFTITEKGTVSNAVVVDSRPRRTFDRSAIQSIRKWRFRPKIIDGRPVPRKARQVIKFKLAKG